MFQPHRLIRWHKNDEIVFAPHFITICLYDWYISTIITLDLCSAHLKRDGDDDDENYLMNFIVMEMEVGNENILLIIELDTHLDKSLC